MGVFLFRQRVQRTIFQFSGRPTKSMYNCLLDSLNNLISTCYVCMRGKRKAIVCIWKKYLQISYEIFKIYVDQNTKQNQNNIIKDKNL